MQKGKWRKLKPGMVLTVEPGCYIRPADNVPKAFWNIGVRIEDDVLVTPKGRDVLTANCPKKVKDVEDAVLGRCWPPTSRSSARVPPARRSRHSSRGMTSRSSSSRRDR